jgi:hypothetical protein
MRCVLLMVLASTALGDMRARDSTLIEVSMWCIPSGSRVLLRVTSLNAPDFGHALYRSESARSPGVTVAALFLTDEK